MAASVCGGLRGPRVLSWGRELPCAGRALHISAVCQGDKPVTYEDAHAPTSSPAVAHTGNRMSSEDHAAERTVEDVFCRKFMCGTFPGCLADQLVLQRRANRLEICALFYFLVGYSENLLSHFYKCPLPLHLQTVPSKVVYKDL
uniref:Uncharacterized protein n=1 Tax=Nomascus leucogenys TaxID=61853 RepID=A0A2I3HEE6_NOMLE